MLFYFYVKLIFINLYLKLVILVLCGKEVRDFVLFDSYDLVISY